jgi:hypothetical protein
MKHTFTITVDTPDAALADMIRTGVVKQTHELTNHTGIVEVSRITTDEADELDKLYVAAAHDEYHKDGEIEIDEGAAVSYGDDRGAYVAAWVWVDENPVIASAREALEAIEDRRAELNDSEGGNCD